MIEVAAGGTTVGSTPNTGLATHRVNADGVAPFMSSASSNSGIAVISLLLSAVFTCPKVSPAVVLHADTKNE